MGRSLKSGSSRTCKQVKLGVSLKLSTRKTGMWERFSQCPALLGEIWYYNARFGLLYCNYCAELHCTVWETISVKQCSKKNSVNTVLRSFDVTCHCIDNLPWSCAIYFVLWFSGQTQSLLIAVISQCYCKYCICAGGDTAMASSGQGSNAVRVSDNGILPCTKTGASSWKSRPTCMRSWWNRWRVYR